MTLEQAWELVKQHETKNVLNAIGDNGRAGGAGQMWWIFRKDYWPSWCWNLLEWMDGLAFRNCLKQHWQSNDTLRSFYERVYNPHASAPDLPAESVEIS